ncbi:AraC family transcriptional regulator [Rosistilla oblonga]|uniref:HTH-type transcriptional regulator GadX n=1 Tax=Rosistilla oblonga TaxID=2527990 RepID=A0A518IS25_9BACT|nr:AraC family transcriptional regulator [Rosistilla oblonga]QDV55882.1 HTH-type transcriptional regulator GadX [Rosistilla oblonga]
MKIELFDARALRPLVRYLEKNGADSQAVLDTVRIPQQLTVDGGWVSKKQAYDFALEVVRHAGSEGAVFAAYHDFELCDLGPIATAMQSCKTVKDALETAARLGSIAYEGSSYGLRVCGNVTWYCYSETQFISNGQQYVDDMTLTIFWHLIRNATELDWQPKQITFAGRAQDRHRAMPSLQECAAVPRGNYSGLAFPTDFLSQRVAWSPPAVALDESDAWRFGPDGSVAIVETLHRVLESQFHLDNLPTLHQLARVCGCSPSTLKNMLRSSGTTYINVLDRLRFDNACELLAVPQATIREIAHELGYSTTSNFVRSFRRMTNMTPGQYRRREFDL